MALTNAQKWNLGTGLYVKDTLALALRAAAEAAITSATTTTGAWVESGFPGDVVVEVNTGTLTGTSVTVDIEIQGADDNSGTNTVSYGQFAQFTETDDDLELFLDACIKKNFVRAVIVTGGTVTSVDPVIVVRDADYHHDGSRTA